jgi:hypothetical protein
MFALVTFVVTTDAPTSVLFNGSHETCSVDFNSNDICNDTILLKKIFLCHRLGGINGLMD